MNIFKSRVSQIAISVLFLVFVTTGCFRQEKAEAQNVSNPSTSGHQNPSGPQVLNFGKGNPIGFDAIKSEAKAPVTFNSEQEFQIRLKNGGTVIISESNLVTGEPNFQKRGLQFMALDTLQLKKGAKIVTGGNDLVIFANKIISEDGSIVAFTDKTHKASDATAAGGSGNPGVDGGTVTLIAINGVDGRLHDSACR